MALAIRLNSYFSDVMQAVDVIINEFVQKSYHNLVANHGAEIVAASTLYVLLLGFKAMRQGFELSEFTRQIVLFLFVTVCATQWVYFDLFFYDIATNAPATMIKTLVAPRGQFNGAAQTIAQGIDNVFVQGMQTGSDVMLTGGLTKWPPLFWGALIKFATLLSCLFALGLLVYAKMAMALLLFLGPFFLFCLLFETTRGLFYRWCQQLINYALVPVLACGILMLSLSVTNLTLGGLVSAAELDEGQMVGVLPFIGFQIVTFYFLLQVTTQSAALSGGVIAAGIGGMSHMVRGWSQQAKTFSNAAGLTRAGVAAKQWATHKAAGYYQQFQQKRSDSAALAKAVKSGGGIGPAGRVTGVVDRSRQ